MSAIMGVATARPERGGFARNATCRRDRILASAGDAAPVPAGRCISRTGRPDGGNYWRSEGYRFRIGRKAQCAGMLRARRAVRSSPGSGTADHALSKCGRESSACRPRRFGTRHPSRYRRLTMTNATITRPEWSTVIDPVLQKELEQHVLVTNWDKLLGIVDTVYNWGRRSALWPLGFGLACCAIEMICTASSRFDIARFGAEVFRGSPRQADLMIVSGTVTKTMMPMIARLYDQMPEPKYVISMGACATGGGPFKEGYNVVSGIDKYLPVDVYIPGCPPTPQALLNGLIMLQKKIDGERLDDPAPGQAGLRALVRQRGRARHPDPGARARPDRPAHRRDRRRADGDGAARRPRGRARRSRPRSPRRSPSRKPKRRAAAPRRGRRRPRP